MNKIKVITEKEIKKQIASIEEQLKTEVNMINCDYHKTLLELHDRFWDLIYFKKHLEKDFLNPPKKE